MWDFANGFFARSGNQKRFRLDKRKVRLHFEVGKIKSQKEIRNFAIRVSKEEIHILKTKFKNLNKT